MKKIATVLFFFLVLQQAASQTVTGTLKAHAGQDITLTGYNYYKSNQLAKTTLDSVGTFRLSYPKTYVGMATLKTQDKTSLILILSGKALVLEGTHLKETDSLRFKNSVENNRFLQIAKNTGLNNSTYGAWRYLAERYKAPYFKKNSSETILNIAKEIQGVEDRNAAGLQNLPKDSYVHWYAPMRSLLSGMPETMRNYTERLPKDIAQFRAIDFTNPNFKTSGLFKELIEGHYFLLENMGQPLDSVYAQMNQSTDNLINNIKNNTALLNTVATNLLQLFERRSLIKAAAHLSETVLNLKDCTCRLEEKLRTNMQKYSALKVGNTAPDIQLSATKKLSDLQTPVLVVFGASHCPACKKEAFELLKYYNAWQAKKQLAVVYISLDTDKALYEKAYKDVPWTMFCDFKGWETQAAKDYFVNATPTYILLDKNRKILEHIGSVAQVESRVNYSNKL
jgi:thiol-disulfide isomerase/thioredoxin